jgi:hypothetical protein
LFVALGERDQGVNIATLPLHSTQPAGTHPKGFNLTTARREELMIEIAQMELTDDKSPHLQQAREV